MTLSEYLDDDLLDALLLISKTDVIVDKLLKKNCTCLNDIIETTSAALACVCYREASNQILIKELLDSNPRIQKMIQEKNDSINLHQIKG